MEYQVRTVYTEETVEALVAVDRVRRKRPLWARIVVWLAGALFIFVGGGALVVQAAVQFRAILYRTGGRWDVGTLIMTAFMIGAGLTLLRPRKRQDHITAQGIWKSYKDKEVETIFRFAPEGYWYRTPVSECSYDYSTLSDFWTDGAYYFLFLGAGRRDAYVLKYTDFTQGDPASFAAALEKWTGKEVRQARREERWDDHS